jgi:hypothetical protein
LVEKLFGKIKQNRIPNPFHSKEQPPVSMKKWTYDSCRKNCSLKTGEMVGMIAQGEENDTENIKLLQLMVKSIWI